MSWLCIRDFLVSVLPWPPSFNAGSISRAITSVQITNLTAFQSRHSGMHTEHLPLYLACAWWHCRSGCSRISLTSGSGQLLASWQHLPSREYFHPLWDLRMKLTDVVNWSCHVSVLRDLSKLLIIWLISHVSILIMFLKLALIQQLDSATTGLLISQLEVDFGIVAACVPTISKLLDEYMSRLFYCVTGRERPIKSDGYSKSTSRTPKSTIHLDNLSDRIQGSKYTQFGVEIDTASVDSQGSQKKLATKGHVTSVTTSRAGMN